MRDGRAGTRPLSLAPTHYVQRHVHSWIDGWADRDDVGRIPPRRVLAESEAGGRFVEFHGPLDAPDLHRRLAAVEPDEGSIARFASEFGALGLSFARPELVELPTCFAWWTSWGERLHAHPETPAHWVAEIARMRRLVDTWDAAVALDHRLLDYVRIQPDGLVWCWPDQDDDDEDDARRTPARFPMAGIPTGRESTLSPMQVRANVAREAVTNQVLEDLNAMTTLRFIRGFGFELMPNAMLAVAYAAFALELTQDEAGRGSLCLECGRLIVGAQRISKRYCSERCKARAKRRRLPAQYKEDEQPADA